MIDCNNEARIQRARQRRKLFQPAELDTAAGRVRIHLIDLSECGAQLHSATPPPVGSFVSLNAGSVRRSARVAWARGTRCGIAFVLPLSAAQLNEVLQLGAVLPERAAARVSVAATR